MRNLSPNNRQIILDRSRIKAPKFDNQSSLSSIEMKKCKFVPKQEKREHEFDQLKYYKKTYKAVEESARMNPETIDRVVGSVNFMSKQLLSDCRAFSKSMDPAPLN